MSKMDGLRAMREARYAESQARAGKAKPAAAKAAPVAPAKPKSKKAAPAKAESEPELCGHRSMNGRTCTREHGHAAKSHRYG